jgi:CRP-like cAMP-binding protein
MQFGGDGIRMPAAKLSAALEESATLRHGLLAYVRKAELQVCGMLLTNITQGIDSRLARALLTARERSQSNELEFTHEELGAILAVRRASVTVSLQVLLKQGLITTRRQTISITNRQGLVSFCDGPEQLARPLHRHRKSALSVVHAESTR